MKIDFPKPNNKYLCPLQKGKLMCNNTSLSFFYRQAHVNENDFIESFIDKVVAEKPEFIVVQDSDKNNIGSLSTKRLSEVLKK